MKTSVAGAVLGVLSVATTLLACGLHDRPKVERRQPGIGPGANTAAGTHQNTAESVASDRVVSPGIVEPWGDQVEVSAQESGWIAQVLVSEGDNVQQGQLLALLDDALQVHAVGVAEAAVMEAEAVLAKLQRGASPEELRQAQAEYDAAVARGQLSVSSESRTTRLHEGGVVSETAWEQASADARVQLALREGAEARLVELRRGPRSEDRLAARAR